jgi:hypothetical protein
MQPGGRKGASDHFLCSVTTKVILNQSELFEGGFELVGLLLDMQAFRERLLTS